MAKRNTYPVRIDLELKFMIDDVAKKNNISFPKASQDIAKTLKQFKLNQKKAMIEIKF